MLYLFQSCVPVQELESFIQPTTETSTVPIFTKETAWIPSLNDEMETPQMFGIRNVDLKLNAVDEAMLTVNDRDNLGTYTGVPLKEIEAIIIPKPKRSL